MPWNNPEVAIETDVEHAKQLLADAGWADEDGDGILERDGVRASFSCLYPADDSVRQAVAMAAAEQVRKIGIEIVVEGTSWDEIARRKMCIRDSCRPLWTASARASTSAPTWTTT